MNAEMKMDHGMETSADTALIVAKNVGKMTPEGIKSGFRNTSLQTTIMNNKLKERLHLLTQAQRMELVLRLKCMGKEGDNIEDDDIERVLKKIRSK